MGLILNKIHKKYKSVKECVVDLPSKIHSNIYALVTILQDIINVYSGHSKFILYLVNSLHFM